MLESKIKVRFNRTRTTVISTQSQDDGFKDVKLEDLNEKVQAAISVVG